MAKLSNVTLFGVVNGPGSSNVVIPMSRLLGDTSGNGSVGASDISRTTVQVGMPIGTNFRTDVNANGTINASDIGVVKIPSGTALPMGPGPH